MDGTLQQFAVAYLGYVEADYVDHVQEWIEKKYPDLCHNSIPFDLH